MEARRYGMRRRLVLRRHRAASAHIVVATKRLAGAPSPAPVHPHEDLDFGGIVGIPPAAASAPPSSAKQPPRLLQSCWRSSPAHCAAAASGEQATGPCTSSRWNFAANVAPSSPDTPATNPLGSSAHAQSSVPRVARHWTWTLEFLLWNAPGEPRPERAATKRPSSRLPA